MVEIHHDSAKSAARPQHAAASFVRKLQFPRKNRASPALLDAFRSLAYKRRVNRFALRDREVR